MNVNAIDLPYEEATPRQERAVFYDGEPIVVTVSLINSTTSVVEVDESWARRLVVRLRRSNGNGSEIPLQLNGQRTSGITRMGSGGKLEATGQITLAPGKPLPNGNYALEVMLPEGVLKNRPPRPNDAHLASLAFEVRAVSTLTDELNALHHASVRARWAGQTERAKVLLDELLRRAPNSPVAHAEMGTLLALQHDCNGAKGAYERAIALSQTGVASEDRILRNAHALAEWAEVSLPERVRSCR